MPDCALLRARKASHRADNGVKRIVLKHVDVAQLAIQPAEAFCFPMTPGVMPFTLIRSGASSIAITRII